MCLRLFDFDDLETEPSDRPVRWQARKIIGEECQVFMIESATSFSEASNVKHLKSCTQGVSCGNGDDSDKSDNLKGTTIGIV